MQQLQTFCLRLSVCLLATLHKNFEWICMKFSGKVGNRPVNELLNFGDSPDHGSRSVSWHWWDVPDGRMHCSSAFSLFLFRRFYVHGLAK